MTEFSFEVINLAKESFIFPETDRLPSPQNEAYRRFVNTEFAGIWCSFFPVCVDDKGKVALTDYRAVIDSEDIPCPQARVDVELELQHRGEPAVPTTIHLTLPAPGPDGSFWVNGIELAFPAVLSGGPSNDLRVLKVNWLDSALGECVRKALEGYASALAERIRYGSTPELTAVELAGMLPVQETVDEFFASSPLLQRIESVNPLARAAQLRRIRRVQSNADRTKSVLRSERSLHPTVYGRFDYLDTPEGPNVGLVHSLCVFADVNEAGEVTAPYRKAECGKPTAEVVCLTAAEDYGKAKAPWNYRHDEAGGRADLWVRTGEAFRKALQQDVELQELSPVQGLGIASCLIPFLGSDDANRAGMAVNMMRQAVPVLGREVPWVMSGAEGLAAKWTNADERFVVDDCLSLGANVLAAFLPWEGYNYEDAIVVSDGLVERDALTCVVEGTKRRLSVGDRLATRHGSNGVISKIVPAGDMPRLPDGRPVEMLLNPMGVPSRMNFGQVLEASAGLAAWRLERPVVSPPYCGATLPEIRSLLRQADLPETGMLELVDPRSGKPFGNPVTVGMQYVFKLNHMVDDKLVHGRQRIGSMEVMAMILSGANGNVNAALRSDMGTQSLSASFSALTEAAECCLISIKAVDADGKGGEDR